MLKRYIIYRVYCDRCISYAEKRFTVGDKPPERMKREIIVKAEKEGWLLLDDPKEMHLCPKCRERFES